MEYIIRHKGTYCKIISVIVLSLILAISIAILALYLYKVVTKDNMIKASVPKSKISSTFDSDALSKVIDMYNTKDENSKKAKGPYNGPSDPSI